MFDPIKTSAEITLSEDTKTMTVSTGSSVAGSVSLLSKTAGKWYAEFVLNTIHALADEIVGIATSDHLVGSLGQDAYSWGISLYDYLETATFGSYREADTDREAPLAADGDIINIAVDMDTQYVWVGLNGVWYGLYARGAWGYGDPETGVNPTFYIGAITGSLYLAADLSTVGSSVTLLTESVDFSYPIPSGFTAWGIPQTFPVFGCQKSFSGFGIYGDSKLISGMGIDFVHQMLAGFGIIGEQGISLEVGVWSARCQRLINTLSGDPVHGFHKQLQTVAAVNDIHGLQKLLTVLNDLTARAYSTPAEVYIDGRPISKRVTGQIVIDYSESNVHNSLAFASTDPELWRWCDPDLMPGAIRVEAQVGIRMMQFIIDTRSGEDIAFSVTCVSVSDKEDSLAEDMDFALTEPMLASEIAGLLTNYCPARWQVIDWVVPVEFTFSGKPMDGLQRLAGEVGAIVRCQDDGSLAVRRKRPMRPVDMDDRPAAVSYENTDLISLSHSEEKESGYNAIRVQGVSEKIFVPQIVIEDVSPQIGHPVYARVYWAGQTASLISTFITSGAITFNGQGEQVEIQRVTFQNGIASVSLPIDQLQGVTWIGKTGGPVTYAKNGTELSIPAAGFAVADVKYRTRFDRYLIHHHYVEMLVAVFFLASGNNVRVSVRTMDAPVYGPEISAALLTTDAAAVERATAWIDENKYRKSILTIEAPHADAAIDGVLAHINDDHIGMPGNYHIQSAKIIIDGPKVTNVLGVEKCRI